MNPENTEAQPKRDRLSVILWINVIVYFLQFIPLARAMNLFLMQLVFNLGAGLYYLVKKDSSLAKAFFLSAVMILLLGPVVMLAGGVVLGIFCFGSMCVHH